jgi:transposase-like protein
VFSVMFVAAAAPPMLEDLRPIVDDWRPDVIVHEPNEVAAAPIAAACAIPHVVVGFGGFKRAEAMAGAETPLRELWSSAGLDLRPWAGLYHDLYLHPFPPSFGPLRSERTIQPMRPMCFDGVDSAEPPGWLERLGVSRPSVYVTFGTEIANRAPFGFVAEAFADLDVDVVVTVGRNLDPDSIKPRPVNASESDVQEVPGRLSNPSPHPVQRRLSPADVDDICASYIGGTSIDELARSHGVNRTTIIKHLDRHGVPRRRVVRKMTDALVAEAAVEYLDGRSLATVANRFNVAIRTLRREFSKAGIATRPRQGWTY